MSDSSSPGKVTQGRKNNRIEDTVIIIMIEDEPYETLDWSLGGFRIGGYKGNIQANAEFLVNGIGPDLDNIFDIRVDCEAIRINDNQLSASFIEMDDDLYDLLEALMSRREKSLDKLKKQLTYSSQADRYLEQANDNVRKIYAAFLKLEAATGIHLNLAAKLSNYVGPPHPSMVCLLNRDPKNQRVKFVGSTDVCFRG